MDVKAKEAGRTRGHAIGASNADGEPHFASPAERRDKGKERRDAVPRDAHRRWKRPKDRRDPSMSWTNRTSAGSNNWCRSVSAG